jgi:hypothetical protein
MAATVIIYERGDTYVENSYDAVTKDAKGKEVKSKKTAHGLVGKLTVGGNEFDTLERMDGYVKLAAGEYPMSSMYVDTKRGKVVNPWLGAALEKNPQYRNILIHAGQVPSHFEGCIGVGVLLNGELSDSPASMEKVWELCGGTVSKGDPIVTVRVVGEMPDIADCTKVGG